MLVLRTPVRKQSEVVKVNVVLVVLVASLLLALARRRLCTDSKATSFATPAATYGTVLGHSPPAPGNPQHVHPTEAKHLLPQPWHDCTMCSAYLTLQSLACSFNILKQHGSLCCCCCCCLLSHLSRRASLHLFSFSFSVFLSLLPLPLSYIHAGMGVHFTGM